MRQDTRERLYGTCPLGSVCHGAAVGYVTALTSINTGARQSPDGVGTEIRVDDSLMIIITVRWLPSYQLAFRVFDFEFSEADDNLRRHSGSCR